jgi:hypothetical protein
MKNSFLALAILTGFTLAACNSGTPKIETVQAPEADPVAEAKAILTNYANGMPITSEAEGFPQLIERVKQKDAAKGEILEKGLNHVKQNPSSAPSKAKELLKQL